MSSSATLRCLLLAAAAAGCSAPPTHSEEDRMETEGLRKCEEGTQIIVSTEPLRKRLDLDAKERATLAADLERGVVLIREGMNLLDLCNQKTGRTWDTARFGQAMKAGRGMLLELR